MREVNRDGNRIDNTVEALIKRGRGIGPLKPSNRPERLDRRETRC